jgi:hypothetical protein
MICVASYEVLIFDNKTYESYGVCQWDISFMLQIPSREGDSPKAFQEIHLPLWNTKIYYGAHKIQP